MIQLIFLFSPVTVTVPSTFPIFGIKKISQPNLILFTVPLILNLKCSMEADYKRFHNSN